MKRLTWSYDSHVIAQLWPYRPSIRRLKTFTRPLNKRCLGMRGMWGACGVRTWRSSQISRTLPQAFCKSWQCHNGNHHWIPVLFRKEPMNFWILRSVSILLPSAPQLTCLSQVVIGLLSYHTQPKLRAGLPMRYFGRLRQHFLSSVIWSQQLRQKTSDNAITRTPTGCVPGCTRQD